MYRVNSRDRFTSTVTIARHELAVESREKTVQNGAHEPQQWLVADKESAEYLG